jgi:regulatory protein
MSARRAKPKDAQAAYDAAAKILARGPYGAEGLIAKLVARGFEEPIARVGVSRLEASGLLKERQSAEAIVYGTKRDMPAGEALIRAKLEQRGVEAFAAEDAVREATGSTDEAAEALTLTEQALAKMPESLDDLSKARRLLGLLARRGFTEEHALDAVRAVVPRAFDAD